MPRGIRAGRRILNQRSWFNYLRTRAIERALTGELDYVTERTGQVAHSFAELLSDHPVPLEPKRGIAARLGRLFRDGFSRGVRYPQHKGPMRATFWERLVDWVRETAETERGKQILSRAWPTEEENWSTQFAFRVMAETMRLLQEKAPTDGQERIRREMARELFWGVSDAEVNRAYRAIQVTVRALAAGFGTLAVSNLGFHDSLLESVGLGAVALVLTSATDVVSHGVRRVTSEMHAVRRQARGWLTTLSTWLVGYIRWESVSIRDGHTGGIDRLVFLLTRVTAREARLDALPADADVLVGLRLVKENAARANDTDLVTALLQIEGALLWTPEEVPDAIARLIELIRMTPDLPAMRPLPAIESTATFGPPATPRPRPPDEQLTGPDRPVRPVRELPEGGSPSPE